MQPSKQALAAALCTYNAQPDTSTHEDALTKAVEAAFAQRNDSTWPVVVFLLGAMTIILAALVLL